MKVKPNRITWVGRILSSIICLPFFLSAFMKLKAGPEVIEGMGQLGLPPTILTPLAILELTCVVFYVIPMTSVLGAILLTGYLGGAILTHLRVGQDFGMQIGFGVIIWLGLYLRETRLHKLLPLRRD